MEIGDPINVVFSEYDNSCNPGQDESVRRSLNGKFLRFESANGECSLEKLSDGSKTGCFDETKWNTGELLGTYFIEREFTPKDFATSELEGYSDEGACANDFYLDSAFDGSSYFGLVQELSSMFKVTCGDVTETFRMILRIPSTASGSVEDFDIFKANEEEEELKNYLKVTRMQKPWTNKNDGQEAVDECKDDATLDVDSTCRNFIPYVSSEGYQEANSRYIRVGEWASFYILSEMDIVADVTNIVCKFVDSVNDNTIYTLTEDSSFEFIKGETGIDGVDYDVLPSVSDVNAATLAILIPSDIVSYGSVDTLEITIEVKTTSFERRAINLKTGTYTGFMLQKEGSSTSSNPYIAIMIVLIILLAISITVICCITGLFLVSRISKMIKRRKEKEDDDSKIQNPKEIEIEMESKV